MTNARDVAVSALLDREGNVSAHLERLLETGRLSPADRGLARELALGTLRRRASLQAVLDAFLARGGRLPAPVNTILLTALYQLLLLERVPAFAAVNEAVEQSGRFGHRRQSGLVNGILRNVLRSLGPVEQGTQPPARDVLPMAPGTFRRLGREVFPDPAANAAGYLAAAYSLPPELASRWLASYGPLDHAAEIAMHANTRAPLIVRVNSLRASVQQVLELLAQGGIAASPHANGLSIVLPEAGDVTALPGFAAGLYQPQDPTATEVGRVCGELLRDAGGTPARLAGKMPASLVGKMPASRVLDFCAAPGTKTTHVAEAMRNEGSILALDVAAEKLQRIDENCRRLGVTNVRTAAAESAGGLEPRSFDLVLADVPCSNTGVLARRAEARWRFTQPALERLVRDQQFLIEAASTFVAPGGHLVYSTCSIEAQENQQMAQYLLRRQRRMKLLREKLTLPGGAADAAKWHDGGYCVVFRAT